VTVQKNMAVLLLSALLLPAQVFAQDDKVSHNENYKVVISDDSDVYVKEPEMHEDFSRGVFSFNQSIDNVLVQPIARGYRGVVPQWGRNRVSSAVDNLNGPVNMLNSALQGDGEKFLANFWRFVINSTLGVGGLMDVAGAAGLETEHEDFGQTLAVWGHKESSYVMLPILGPSTGRDTVGKVVDKLTNPLSYIGFPLGAVIQGTTIVSKREALLDITDEIEENSFDPYATVRSAYFQHRKREISK
jgi:phospholipid-binding lipoprotein MlaA